MRCLSCRKTISDSKAVYTKPCRHVFCMQCSSKTFQEELVCPSCDTVLPKDGVVEMDLHPDKSVIQKASEPGLGMQPKYLCQILQNGLEFWAQQQQNENSIYLQVQKRLKEELTQEKALTRKLTLSLENEKQKSTTLARENEELQHQLLDMEKRSAEKSRSLRKLNEMYSELRQVHKRLESDLRGTKIDEHVHVEHSSHPKLEASRGSQEISNRRRKKHGTSRSDLHETSRRYFKERPRSTSISRSLHLSLPGSARGSAPLTSEGLFDFKLDSRQDSRADSKPSHARSERRDRDWDGGRNPRGATSSAHHRQTQGSDE